MLFHLPTIAQQTEPSKFKIWKTLKIKEGQKIFIFRGKGVPLEGGGSENFILKGGSPISEGKFSRGRLITLCTLWRRKRKPSNGGIHSRWCGGHTLIYKGCPVGGGEEEGSPLHAGESRKLGYIGWLFLVTHWSACRMSSS